MSESLPTMDAMASLSSFLERGMEEVKWCLEESKQTVKAEREGIQINENYIYSDTEYVYMHINTTYMYHVRALHITYSL